MNDLLAQFLLECRELIDAATEDLLALEKSPRDKDRVDSVFRGFHTLKGAAGIVDFPAMGDLMHAAEDVLASVRAGQREVSGELIGDCLSCLDQLTQWLDATDSLGEIPAVPEAAAPALLARLKPPAAAATAATGDDPAWLAAFLARHGARLHLARTAFRYEPDSDCFLRNEDPLAIVAGIPGLLAVELASREPWPSLDEMSVFECNLVITVLTATSPQATLAALGSVARQTEIRGLAGSDTMPGGDLPPDAIRVLEEQLRLASIDGDEGLAGRLGAAARVAANVLRRSGRAEAARTISDAAASGGDARDGERLVAALRAVLETPATIPPHDVPEITLETAPPLVHGPRGLRVDVDRIDALVKLAGELTVAKNAIGHTARRARDGADVESLARALKEQHVLLDRLVARLQRSVQAVRVLPLRQTFQRFPRVVREISRDLGKQVRLAIDGETTEADRATVEALFEPLMHVLRNALDHGIETPAERAAAGKSAIATISLRATRDGDQVIVEVGDDGRGIDTASVRRVAARRGVASEGALAGMTDQAVTELIFSPGFSTAAAVTGISGRGVGMDAVRSAVTRLGGRVSLVSEPGAGTSVRFTLPYSVMLLRVLTVEAGGQVFGIPIDAIVETIRVPRGRVASLGAAEAMVLRDRTVPFIRLAENLDLPSAKGPGPDENARIVVAATAGQVVALEVENFGEHMDVMLKPMDGLLSGSAGFAGTTLLGDGRVLIVLDLQALLA